MPVAAATNGCNVVIPWQLFTGNNVVNRRVGMTNTSPGISLNGIATSDPVYLQTDTNGTVTYSNVVAGSYGAWLVGPFAITPIYFGVPATNSVTINVTNLLVAPFPGPQFFSSASITWLSNLVESIGGPHAILTNLPPGSFGSNGFVLYWGANNSYWSNGPAGSGILQTNGLGTNTLLYGLSLAGPTTNLQGTAGDVAVYDANQILTNSPVTTAQLAALQAGAPYDALGAYLALLGLSNYWTLPNEFATNVFLAGTRNTASNQVFGAFNLLTGTLADARYGQLTGSNYWAGTNWFGTNVTLGGSDNEAPGQQSIISSNTLMTSGLTTNVVYSNTIPSSWVLFRTNGIGWISLTLTNAGGNSVFITNGLIYTNGVLMTGGAGATPTFNTNQFGSSALGTNLLGGVLITNPVIYSNITINGTNVGSWTFFDVGTNFAVIQSPPAYTSNGYTLTLPLALTNSGPLYLSLSGSNGTLWVTNFLNVASHAANPTVAVTGTGITNSFAVNAFAFVTCTAITSYVTNAAGTCVLTNTSATYVHQGFPLQPNGSIVAASGLSGTLVPF